MKTSGYKLGVYSFLLSLIPVLGCVTGFYYRCHIDSENSFIINVFIGLGYLIIVLCPILGLILGSISFIQKDKLRVFPVLGVILSLTWIVFAVLMFTGI